MSETQTWLNLTDAARAIGEHRQQLQRMLRAGKIPKRLIRDTSPPMLRLEGLAEAVAGAKRRRIDSKPAPPLEPVPLPPAGPTLAEIQEHRTHERLAAALNREQAWITHYSEFHRWVIEDAAHDLHREFRDLEQIGAVMTWLRGELVRRIKPLDACELESRFPR